MILEANRESLDSVEEFRTLMNRAGRGKNVLLLVSRKGSTFFTTISAG